MGFISPSFRGRNGTWLIIFVLAVSAFSAAPVATAQSVADAARQSREQREKAASKPAKVITNDDFENSAAASDLQVFPTVLGSFRVPEGWTLGGTTDETVLFFCPGTSREDQCFILVRVWASGDSSPDWKDRCLVQSTQQEPLAGADVLEPWHDVVINQLPARQTVIDTGDDGSKKSAQLRQKRKFIELADTASRRCYSFDVYAPIAHANEYFAAYDALVASFRPFPEEPQVVEPPKADQPPAADH